MLSNNINNMARTKQSFLFAYVTPKTNGLSDFSHILYCSNCLVRTKTEFVQVFVVTHKSSY